MFKKPTKSGKNIAEVVNKDIGCGPLWSTIFGEASEVKSEVNPSNEAYGNDYLPCHIDLPYYTQPPSAYFFYCLKNECQVRQLTQHNIAAPLIRKIVFQAKNNANMNSHLNVTL